MRDPNRLDNFYLEIPCSYQGGKQRLAKQIVDIFLCRK